ncbi:AAA family ATPase [Streptomyces platensis]|uniref:AAA family ATPase n=1 Tax=Streptomyces platensis TaxID=58346 RepID=UPI001F30B35B|nr:AAA family ATPase [Streptomyces platensis]
MGTETAEFAGQLRRLKERSGRSYGVLAGQLHMSVATLHRYCHGDAVPREFAPADRLARRCGATPDELVELHRRWILADEARRRSRGGATGATSAVLSGAARSSAPAAVDVSAAVPDSAVRTSDTAPGEPLGPVTTSPTGSGALVGREAEVERTAALVRRADGTDPVLIVTGDPGAGKTALLDRALHTARAAGTRVLRAEGAVPEAELAFSGLHQLLSPVLAEAEGLPVRQRDALLAAFGMNTQEAERDPLLIGLAAGALLSRVAARRRLLVVVDDAQWIDADSLRTLGFVARRLHGPQVALLVAARDTTRLTGLGRGRPTLELGPLDPAAARQLLDQQRCPPTGPTRRQVLDQSAGNPLALIEFAAAHAAGRATPTHGGEPLPPTEQLERSFAHRWRQLPEATRQALLLAAADTTAVTHHDPQVWRPAEDAGLVRRASGGVRFHHPLVRSALYHAATPEQRRQAHLAAAAAPADAPDRQAWHRAAAATGPDEDVAAALERTAERTQQRGGYAEAATAWNRAAELSPVPDEGARRFVRAAQAALVSGQLSWVEQLADRALARTDDRSLRALASLRAGQALALTPRRTAASAVLLRTAEECRVPDPALAREALATVALVAYYTGDPAQQRAVQQLLPRVGGERSHDLVRLWTRAVTDPSSDREGLLTELHALVGAANPPGALTALGTVAWLLDETSLALTLFHRAAHRPAGPPLPATLRCASGWASLDHGEWEQARELADASARGAADSGLVHTSAAALTLHAGLSALRGETGAARTAAEEALAAVTPHGSGSVVVRARWALGMAATAEGDHETACAQLRPLFTAEGEPAHYHASLPGLADLAAAAARTGRHDQATLVVEQMAERLEHGSARQRTALFRARALLAGTDTAEGHFTAALAQPAAEQRPFEHAQVLLDYGAWLRRRLRTSEARTPLTAAREIFRRLGAQPWADRTTAELRAAGVRQPVPETPALESLTAQQQQIVRLAAQGLTNREIGERLMLSPRTVGSHLYRSFPKLGVATRAQLRDLMDQLPASGTPPQPA